MMPIPGSLFEQFPPKSGYFSTFPIADLEFSFLRSVPSFQIFVAVVFILVYSVFMDLCLSKCYCHLSGGNELNANG